MLHTPKRILLRTKTNLLFNLLNINIMGRLYISYEEDEAYRQGKKDAMNGRKDIWRNSHANYDTPDRAYFDGQNDGRREKETKRLNDKYWDEEYERWRNGS